MEERQELREYLERLERANQKQSKYAKWQCIFSLLAAISCVGVLLIVCTLMPQAKELTIQMETVLTDMQTISKQLVEADLGGMVQNVDTLVTTSQAGVEQMMEELNTIDFETLNKAIGDLAAVIEPLANFVKFFQ